MAKPKRHHYVPQFLLRQFIGANDKIHVYDKTCDRVFATSVDNVAAETGFYNAEIAGSRVSAESAMGKMEADVAPLVARVVKNESIASLTRDERARISLFVAVQLVRTRNYRNLLREALAALRGMPGENEAMPGSGTRLDEAAMAAQQIAAAASAPDMAPHVYSKVWVLLKNASSRPYFISDNPVAFQNTKYRESSLGLDAAGIEVYLPLSSTLTLSFVCQQYYDQMLWISRAGQRLRARHALPEDLRENARRIDEMLTAIRTGGSLEQSVENVTNQNSLQVLSAERYVLSSTDDFALVKAMLEREPELRRGGPTVAFDDRGVPRQVKPYGE